MSDLKEQDQKVIHDLLKAEDDVTIDVCLDSNQNLVLKNKGRRNDQKGARVSKSGEVIQLNETMPDDYSEVNKDDFVDLEGDAVVNKGASILWKVDRGIDKFEIVSKSPVSIWAEEPVRQSRSLIWKGIVADGTSISSDEDTNWSYGIRYWVGDEMKTYDPIIRVNK